MHYTEYDTRLAAYAVIIDDDDVLLALWNEGPTPLWTLPGGGVEFEETVEAAAVREVEEETGYRIALGELLGVHTHVIGVAARRHSPSRARGDRPLKAVRVFFAATVIGGNLRNEVEGTTDEARWFPLSAVQELPRVPIVDIALELATAARP